jgi:hypothetical protein
LPGLIDIHTHWCLFGRDPAEVEAELAWLEAGGFEKVAVFPLPGLGAAPEKILDMVPGAYRELAGLNATRTGHDDLDAWHSFQRRWRQRPRTLELLSFLDIRGWDGKTDLSPWWGAGHTGLKSIIIEAEDDPKMHMPPLRRVSGITRRAYLEAQRAMFDAAAHYNVPFIYHADLTLHGGFVEECLQAHPRLRVNIPHFGFSRKHMAAMLDRYPAVMTDISSLGPFMDKDPVVYRDFINAYPDRIMLGSDAIACYDMRPAMEYAHRVRSLGLPSSVEAGVLAENARRFLSG